MEDLDTVRIDPALVPDCEYDLICADLYASITEAFANPQLRQEYEDWKKKNAACAAV